MAKIVKIRIVGISPLLMNNPAKMVKNNANNDALKAGKKVYVPEEEAKAAAYINGDGQFYIHASSFKASIINPGGGASGRKIGKYGAASRVVAGMLVVSDQAIICDPKSHKPAKGYSIDERRGVRNKAGIIIWRPRFEEWETTITVEVDEDFVTVPQLIELLNLSGKVAGVGDFRPQKRGPFGRYTAELVAA